MVLATISCGGNKKGNRHANEPGNETPVQKTIATDTVFFFSGEFLYFADAAVLKDCATGSTLPVSADGEYLKTERQFISMDRVPETPVHIEFMGRRIIEPSMEEGRIQTAYVIDELLLMKADRRCHNDRLLTGIYDAGTPASGTTYRLTLHPDYTCRLEIRPENEIQSGVWHRTREDRAMIVLGDGTQRYPADIVFGTKEITLRFPEFINNAPLNFTRMSPV